MLRAQNFHFNYSNPTSLIEPDVNDYFILPTSITDNIFLFQNISLTANVLLIDDFTNKIESELSYLKKISTQEIDYLVIGNTTIDLAEGFEISYNISIKDLTNFKVEGYYILKSGEYCPCVIKEMNNVSKWKINIRPLFKLIEKTELDDLGLISKLDYCFQNIMNILNFSLQLSISPYSQIFPALLRNYIHPSPLFYYSNSNLNVLSKYIFAHNFTVEGKVEVIGKMFNLNEFKNINFSLIGEISVSPLNFAFLNIRYENYSIITKLENLKIIGLISLNCIPPNVIICENELFIITKSREVNLNIEFNGYLISSTESILILKSFF